MAFFNRLRGYKAMSEPVKASLWYTVCNVLRKGIALLATPIFTRIMTQDQYGIYSIFMSWYNILFIVATLNVNLNSYTKGLLLYKEHESSFTSSQLGFCTTLTTVLLAVYLLFRDFWTQALDMSPVLMGAMFLLLYATPATEFWASREQFNYKYKKYVIITIASTITSLVLGVLAVVSTDHKTEARVYTDVLTKAAIGFGIYFLLMRRGRCFFKKDYWKYGLMFNLPLIPHYMSNYVLNQADRIMIGDMVGTSQAAMYSVAYTISTVIMLIVTAVNNSLVPYIYKSIDAREQRKIRGSTTPLFLLITALCILTMCFAPEVILIFAGSDYADAIWVIPPIAASVYFIFVYSMYSTVEYYYQKTLPIAIASCVSAVANLVLNYIFIKLFGYYAAGYTTLACYILLALFHYVSYRRILRKELPGEPEFFNTKVILAYSVMILAVMLIMVLTYRYTAIRYGLVLILVIVAVIKRKKIIEMLHSIKK